MCGKLNIGGILTDNPKILIDSNQAGDSADQNPTALCHSGFGAFKLKALRMRSKGRGSVNPYLPGNTQIF
jgi:hypothetical protein